MNKVVNILIVEDSEVEVIYIESLFAKMQIVNNIDIAFDGQSAIEKLSKKKYDLILVDLNIPNIKGLQVIKYIRSQKRNASSFIVILTGSQSSRDIEKAKKLNVDTYYKKSLKVENLEEILENFNKLLCRK